jgi:hypothetical protein
VSDARSLGAEVATGSRGGGALLRALDGDLHGGTAALRRRLFAVICVVVVCELFVILAVGTGHPGGEQSSARSGDAPSRSDQASRPAAAERQAP